MLLSSFLLFHVLDRDFLKEDFGRLAGSWIDAEQSAVENLLRECEVQLFVGQENRCRLLARRTRSSLSPCKNDQGLKKEACKKQEGVDNDFFQNNVLRSERPNRKAGSIVGGGADQNAQCAILPIGAE